MKILIGTNNKDKLKNYIDAFALFAPEVELISPAEAGIEDDPTEDESTVLGNAIKKAKFYGEKSGLITLVDDTGLFVDALNGEPGLHAKRWHEGNDHDRCMKLLERLNGKNRDAHYGQGFAAYNPENKTIWTYEHAVDGFISDEIKDRGGFGYDKIFKVKSSGKHYSELSLKEKTEIGGRGTAVKELVLNSNFLK